MTVTEVLEFLAETVPFNRLGPDAIADLARCITVSYCRACEPIAVGDDQLMIVRTGHFSVLGTNGELISTLQPGDFHGLDYLVNQVRVYGYLRCEEDSLLYWLSAVDFHALCKTHPDVDQFFRQLIERRLHQLQDNSGSGFSKLIGSLIRRRKVSASVNISVQSAAAVMTHERVSSLLVENEGELIGIITDRDFRSRVVYKNLPGDTPIMQVMTRNPITISSNSQLFEAMRLMSEHNVHHLPVVSVDGEIHGVITATDVSRNQRADPVYLINDIHRQQSQEGLVKCAGKVRDLTASLAHLELPAHHASHILTTVTDALTQAWIKLEVAKLGPPPCIFSWLAFGSQARQEQALNADQDNALLLASEPEGEIGSYFEALATLVCDGLNECGLAYCPGNIMASNPELRLSLRGWVTKFENWMDSPTQDALMRAGIFFDLRSIYGSQSLMGALQQDVLARARENEIFLYHMAKNALSSTTPLGLFKTFTLERDGKKVQGLDLKKRGILLITNIARIYSLDRGLSIVNTRQRLQCIGRENMMVPEDCQSLIDAFDLLAQMRWDKHQRDVAAERTVSNFLDPADVSGLQRHQLKDAFEVINQAQRRMQFRYCQEL